MNAEQGNDIVVIQYSSILEQIVYAALSIVTGAFLFFLLSAEFEPTDTFGLIFMKLVVLFFCCMSAYFLFFQPNILTLDKDKGEFAVLHGMFVWRWKKAYSLTDIKAVVLVTLTNTGDTEGDGCFVELIIQRPKNVFNPTDKHLKISFCDHDWSSKKVMAERVASMLGLSIQEETIKSIPISLPPSGT